MLGSQDELKTKWTESEGCELFCAADANLHH